MINAMAGTFCPQRRGATRHDITGEKFSGQICIGITSHKSRAPERGENGSGRPPRSTGAMGATALNTVQDSARLASSLPTHRRQPTKLLTYVPSYLSTYLLSPRIAPRHVRRVHLPLWPKFGVRFERHEKRNDYVLTCGNGGRRPGTTIRLNANVNATVGRNCRLKKRDADEGAKALSDHSVHRRHRAVRGKF